MHFVNAKGILSAHNGMNVYRGCTHGCIYCDSRSACYQMKHDFEDIEVKQNAPQLLEKALRSKKQKCMIATGAMCDPYMHCEESLRLTRQCLEIIDHHGFGLCIQTKSSRILRDMDLLKSIHRKAKCVVQMTLTTHDEALCRILEPHVSTTRERVDALMRFRDAGIPTVVWLCPILPFINDTEDNIRAILGDCFRAGVKGIISFGMGVTLRQGDREYFYRQLDRHFPGMRQKYHDAYGFAYEVPSPQNDELMTIFHTECKKHGVMHHRDQIFAYLSQFPENEQVQQMSLF